MNHSTQLLTLFLVGFSVTSHLPLALGAEAPRDLVAEFETFRSQLAGSTDSLFDGWISAAAAHKEASQPSFRAATKHLREIKGRVLQSLRNREITWVDKAALAGRGNVTTPHYEYINAEDRLLFRFPFAEWDERSFVFVWDSRAANLTTLAPELRRDYVMASVDNLIMLTASTLYSELRTAHGGHAQIVVMHVFGSWYGSQAIERIERSR